MGSAASFVGQFFPLFLLGALFGKLMEDSGSVTAIAEFMTAEARRRSAPSSPWCWPAPSSPMAASGLFVALFVLAPMAEALFRVADIPRRLMPPAIALGTFTFTMMALPGTPAIQNAIPMPFFGTTPFAAPGLGIIASAIMLGFGLWWLARAEARARRAGEGFDGIGATCRPVLGRPGAARAGDDDARVRSGGDRRTAARAPTRPSDRAGRACRWSLVILVNLLMSLRRPAAARLLLPRRAALGRHHLLGRGRRVVGGGGA